jgi:hypothetical protein
MAPSSAFVVPVLPVATDNNNKHSHFCSSSKSAVGVAVENFLISLASKLAFKRWHQNMTKNWSPKSPLGLSSKSDDFAVVPKITYRRVNQQQNTNIVELPLAFNKTPLNKTKKLFYAAISRREIVQKKLVTREAKNTTTCKQT